MAATPAPWGWLPYVVRMCARGTAVEGLCGVIEHCDYEILVSDVGYI